MFEEQHRDTGRGKKDRGGEEAGGGWDARNAVAGNREGVMRERKDEWVHEKGMNQGTDVRIEERLREEREREQWFTLLPSLSHPLRSAVINTRALNQMRAK